MNTPPHLGGHCGITHVDTGALSYFHAQGCRAMIDIGCGPGGQVAAARELGFDAWGVDGDASVSPDILHDYTTGSARGAIPTSDLLWMVEFLEHLDAEFLRFLSRDIRLLCPRFILITHALPGEEHGHHHVNCQPPEYWRGFFAAIGYRLSERHTAAVKERSSMTREFIQNTGAVYVPA